MGAVNFVKTMTVGGLFALALASAAPAATLSFDGVPAGSPSPLIYGGFQFDPVRIVNGNCGASNPCLALNDNETTTITRVGGGTFSLVSFWFQLLGRGTNNTLIVTSTGGSPTSVNLPESIYPHNTGFTVSMLSYFSNVTSIMFSTVDGGNVRIDDLVLTTPPPATVPLPGALGLMGMALGGLGLVRRRKTVTA